MKKFWTVAIIIALSSFASACDEKLPGSNKPAEEKPTKPVEETPATKSTPVVDPGGTKEDVVAPPKTEDAPKGPEGKEEVKKEEKTAPKTK